MPKHPKILGAASALALMASAAWAEDRTIAYIKGYTGDEYYTSQECGVLEAGRVSELVEIRWRRNLRVN